MRVNRTPPEGHPYYLVFTLVPGESYRRRFGLLLLCSCGVFRALINFFFFLFVNWVGVSCMQEREMFVGAVALVLGQMLRNGHNVHIADQYVGHRQT